MSTETKIDPTQKMPAEGAKSRTAGHLWLQRMVGEWTTEAEFTMPDGSKMSSTGTESVRKLGEYWVVVDSKGEMPDGAEAQMVLTFGYDPVKGKFVGSFVGSMMAGMWVYEGALDGQGALVLDTEGEDMMDESKLSPYRDTIRFESDDHRVQTTSAKGPNGEWMPFMTTHARRAR